MDNSTSKSFKRFFEFKGNVAPIAEKANRNFNIKNLNPINTQQRLHYFAIGHVFKSIDTEKIFTVLLDEVAKVKKPTKFSALQNTEFTFINELKCLMSDIRNINSHFIHDFEKIKIDSIDKNIIEFLKQSFELAVLQTCMDEKNINYEEFTGGGNPEKEIVDFLCDKFYPKIDNSKDLSEHQKLISDFKKKSKDEAINEILFINVSSDYNWNIFETHTVFKISKGKYLSFEACLFLLAMFLYKGEANQLISKIKGFKRNDDNKFMSKRNLFTFFSKKFSSQDIDSEENHLVKFRDLVQYLNHYPTVWNKYLELGSNNPIMTERLKEKIIELEIKRCFPELASNSSFNQFAINYIFKNGKIIECENNNIYLDIINKNDEVRKIYFSIKNNEFNRSEFKDNSFKMFALKYVVKEYYKENKAYADYLTKQIKDKEKTFDEELITNKKVEKLKKQISQNLNFIFYGRNQDRFMEFATRYLAETGYFGKDAKFKMYEFFTTDEQIEEIDRLKRTISKKEFDKLKFHQGKLVHCSTYADHIAKYKNWDTPFVVENNAVQLTVCFDNGQRKILSIQRNLMPYFLEDALYNMQNDKIEGAGKILIENYYNYHKEGFEKSRLTLKQNDTISLLEKATFKKILPKRLLHRYSPAVQNNLPEHSTYKQILTKTKEAEERYVKLLEKAKKDGYEEDFLKRNKGKQFKLRFIRKAWNILFFKDHYLKQVQFSGHHRRFNISREEFNDFSKWMFAFDETPKYKDYLMILFEQKGFLEISNFRTLFVNSSSLDGLYGKTKAIYEGWMQNNNTNEKNPDKYSLKNYEKFFTDELFYINVSHFIAYLDIINKIRRNEKGGIIYPCLENEKHLITEYYYKVKLEENELKNCKKLFNKLMSAKLEDALLYEISMYYLGIDNTIVQKARTNVTNLLNQDVVFNINDANSNHLYDLSIPFNKIDSYVELIKHKEDQENDKKNKKTSFLGNMPSYIVNVICKETKNKESCSICNKYINFKKLDFDDLNKINNHILSNSVKFTQVALSFEEYFIFNEKKSIIKNNRIDVDEFSFWNAYFSDSGLTRKKAFHFGVPKESYDDIIARMENKFVKEQIRPSLPLDYNSFNKQQKSICDALLKSIHSSYFNHREKDKKKKRNEANNMYYKEVILKK